jgi:hypothetical protein
MSTVSEEQTTPLITLLRLMTDGQREEFAGLAGTSVGYLYQIGGAHRLRISARLAFSIEDASKVMHERSGEFFPIVTAREVALMHDVSGLEG